MSRRELVNQKVQRVSKEEVRSTMKKMKSGNAVGQDEVPVEVWRCLEQRAVNLKLEDA